MLCVFYKTLQMIQTFLQSQGIWFIWSILASSLKFMDFNFLLVFFRILVNLLPLEIEKNKRDFLFF